MVGFFQNGGARAYVVRVVANDALNAVGDLSTCFRFTAYSKGAWGNLVRVVVAGNPNYYDAATATYSRFDVSVQEEPTDGSTDFTTKESFEALSLTDEDDPNYILTVMNAANTGSIEVTVEKLSGGIPASLQSIHVVNESIDTGTGTTQSFTHTLAGPVVALDTLQISVAGTLMAVDDGIGNISAVSGTGISGNIDYETGVMNIFFMSAPGSGQAITADYYTAPASSTYADLINGSDGTPSSIGRAQVSASSLAANKQGIYALNSIDEMLNIGLMDWSADKTISIDLITYCRNRKDCVAILDCGRGLNSQAAVRYKRNTLGSISDFAAIYWPRVKVADELKNGVSRIVSPVGFVAGCWARTDIEKNVGKTPAGVQDGQLYGIQELEFKDIHQGDRDILYPASINPLREDVYVGRCLWGGKTLAITGDFTRINARRLFIFLEKSTFGSTHDLVFENIGAQLYSKIKLRMEGFFAVLFEDGYFRGETPQQAYRIVVDESNNPPEIVNARQVIIDIYVAVNEPSEFVRFRFQRQFPTT
jgi:phage tail sheath protein FI